MAGTIHHNVANGDLALVGLAPGFEIDRESQAFELFTQVDLRLRKHRRLRGGWHRGRDCQGQAVGKPQWPEANRIDDGHSDPFPNTRPGHRQSQAADTN